MILKKPYAFIIKNFRIIHMIMLACLLFLIQSADDIGDFFRQLQVTSTYIYQDATVYINNIVFGIGFILLFLTGVLFWLLYEKKKPIKLYLGLLVYCIFIFIGFAFEFNLLNVVSKELIESEQIILGKDLAMIITYPGYFFVVICFIRGIGFNIKQFNFSKDIEELEIVDKDSEEFEVLIGKNNYKYFRFARRALRETKYYILENLFAIKCIAVVVVLLGTGYGIYYYNNYLKGLKEQESTTVNGISYTVRNSYITEKDYLGNLVKEGYKFVVVDMTFFNSNVEEAKLDLEKITLANGDLIYHPTLNFNSKFYDLGIPYSDGKMINVGQALDASLAFEIPASVSTTKYQLRVRYDLTERGNGVIDKFKKFDVYAERIDSDNVGFNNNINEAINTNVVNRNSYSLVVRGYELRDSFDSRYILCKTIDECRALSKVITPDRPSENTMLVVSIDSIESDNAVFTKTFNTTNKIFSNFCFISYRIGNKKYSTKAKIVSGSNVDDKVFINIDRKIYKASDISLIFRFRDQTFTVPLKNS